MEPELTAVLASLAESLAALKDLQAGRKDISGTPNAQLIFGPAGLFSNFGLDSTVINAHIQPRGIDRALPAIGTTELNPIYAFITGFEADGEEEPEGPCDDAPGGVMETCHQTAAFGRYTRASQEMEVNTLMQVMNNRLTTDLQVLGSILGTGHQLLSQQTAEQGNWVNQVLATQMVIVGVELQRLLSRQTWQGDPAKNATSGGYKEFPGLDILVSTGKVDAFTGAACPALDPDVKEFGYNDVAGESPDIVNVLSMMAYYLQHNAERMGLDPVQWVIAMRPELFWEVTAVWPCRYLTNRCADASGASPVVINDDNYVRQRDDMRNNSYLMINGLRYPVITDDGIFEYNSTNSDALQPGEFASDIYVLPLRAKNIPTLYWEYLDYTKAMAEVAALQGKQFWATDGGRYMWTLQQKNYCFKVQAKIEPRLVLRTPQLAGRLQHVKYTPLQHLRSPFPESPYFVKGGNESYTDWSQGLYSEWSQ